MSGVFSSNASVASPSLTGSLPSTKPSTYTKTSLQETSSHRAPSSSYGKHLEEAAVLTLSPQAQQLLTSPAADILASEKEASAAALPAQPLEEPIVPTPLPAPVKIRRGGWRHGGVIRGPIHHGPFRRPFGGAPRGGAV